MSEVTVRELRNQGGKVLDRVERGETLIVTKAGRPVAELRPLRRAALAASTLLERWSKLQPVDPNRLRRDIDAILDQSL